MSLEGRTLGEIDLGKETLYGALRDSQQNGNAIE